MSIKHVAIVLLALALGLGAGYLVKRWSSQPHQPAITEGDHRAMYAELGSDVVLYSLSTCPFCKRARDLLTAHGVSFIERTIDQSADAKREAAELEIDGVPVIFVGRYRIQGYNEEEILRLVRQTATAPVAAPAEGS